jgi:hypothetical protein
MEEEGKGLLKSEAAHKSETTDTGNYLRTKHK